MMENLRFTKIGSIEHGVDGSDQYLLVTDLGDSVSEAELQKHLTEMYWRDCNHAGGYFCHRVDVIELCSNEFIAIIHHEYDV